jgi:hypothetical protein
MMPSLSPEAARLIASTQFVRVATLTARGAPHVAPFWFNWDGERIVLNTLKNATARHIRARARATVMFSRNYPTSPASALWLRGPASAYTQGDVPLSVLAGSEAIDRRHADEIASPAFARYAAVETRPITYVEIVPQRWGWTAPTQGDRLLVETQDLPATARGMLEQSETACVADAAVDGWPRLVAVSYMQSRNEIECMVPTGLITGGPIAVMVDLGTCFEELRGVLIRGTPHTSGELGKENIAKLVPERVSWWDLAQPEGR